MRYWWVTKETVKRMPSAKANEPNRPVKQELFLRSKVATWRLFARLLSNQNQTYRQEIEGGYLWSPKRNANGVRNPFYEFMREVAPGDLVFSFVDTRIPAFGIVASYCYESPTPAGFGKVGLTWEMIGCSVR